MSRSQLPKFYIANGSRYQARISYSFLVAYQPGVPGDSTFTTNIGNTGVEELRGEHAKAGDVCHVVRKESEKESIVNVCIGELVELPRSVTSISIELGDASKRQTIPREAIDNGRGDTSIIITEEGSIHYNFLLNSRPLHDWMWISGQDCTNHRPKKYFVANASGRTIKVTTTGKSYNSEAIHIESGKTATIDHNHSIKISGKDVYPPKPRTSIVVCSGLELKTTGQLYGNDIEEEKWKVDGQSYKPPPFVSRVPTFMMPASMIISTFTTVFSSLMSSVRSAMLLLFLLCLLILCFYCVLSYRPTRGVARGGAWGPRPP